jgi:DnaD/phage-associated family protein
MPKYRQLHLKTLDSFDFNEMPDDFTRVVWMLLMLILDSEGRGIYNMAWIRSKMFPIRQDVKIDELQAAFDWLKNRAMIKVYQVDGREYFYIPKWKNYQSGTKKEAESLLPVPPELLRSSSGVNKEEVSAAALYCIESESELNCIKAFDVYQNNIGLLTSAISEKLQADIDEYSEEWVIDAIKESARQEKRSLAYVEGILKSWKRNGKGTEKPAENRYESAKVYDE